MISGFRRKVYENLALPGSRIQKIQKHLLDSSPLKMWPTGCPETSIITTTRRVITHRSSVLIDWNDRKCFKIIKPLSTCVLTSQHYPYTISITINTIVLGMQTAL